MKLKFGSNQNSFDPTPLKQIFIRSKKKRPPLIKRAADVTISIPEIVNFFGNLKQD